MVFAAFKEFQLMPPSPRPTVKRRRNFNQQRSMRLQFEEKKKFSTKKNIKVLVQALSSKYLRNMGTRGKVNVSSVMLVVSFASYVCLISHFYKLHQFELYIYSK